MAGRYFTLPDSQYSRESQYVPLPFDRIMAAAQSKQRQYDKVDEDIYNTQKMFKINAMPEEMGYRDEKVKEYNNRLAAIADEFHKKGEVAQMPGKIRSLARDYANDPEVKLLEYNYQNYLKQQEDTQRLYKEDKYDPTIYDEHAKYATNYDPQKTGLKRFDYQGTFASNDWSKKGLELVKDIAADQTAWADVGPIDANGIMIDSKGTSKHLTDTKVGKLMINYADGFIGSSEGRYWLDQKINQMEPGTGHVDYKKLPAETQQLFREEAAKDLYNLASKQVFEQKSIDKSSKSISDALRHERQLGDLNAGSETGNPQADTVNNLLEKQGLNIFNSDGSLNISSNPLNSNVVTFQKPGEKEFTTKTYNSDKERDAGEKEMEKQGFIVRERKADSKDYDKKLTEAYNKLYNLAKKLNIDVKDGNVPKHVFEYFQNIAKTTSETANIADDVAKALDEHYVKNESNLHNMEIYKQGDINGNTKATNEDVSLLANNSRISGIDYYAPKGAAFKIVNTPKDEKGKAAGVDVPYIAIPRDKQFIEQTKPVADISRAWLEFSSTGDINPQFNAIGKDQNLIKQIELTTGGKYVGSSVEYHKDGTHTIRAVTNTMENNEPSATVIKMTIDKNGNVVGKTAIHSLQTEQEEKTKELNKPQDFKQDNGAFVKHIANYSIKGR